jgi:hypothetical protein
MKPKPSAGLKPKPTPPLKPQMTRQQRINKAGEEAGKKRPGNKRTNAQRQKNAQTARNKAASRANKNSPGQSGVSAADGVSTAAGAIPPGGTGQSSGYGNMASSMAMSAGPGLLSTGLSAGMGAAGAFATSAAEGTSPSALENAMAKGTRKGQNAADAVTNGLKGIAASGSQTGTVAGKTGGVEGVRKKLCLCPDDATKYMRAQRGLPEGLKELYGSYYRLESKCKCTEDNEKLKNYVFREIVNSKNILMSNGRQVGRTGLYKDTAEKVKSKQTRGPIGPTGLPVIARGGYMRLAGTRKKSGHAINKKSRTRKQQKTQFRRRTRKI